MWQKTIRLKNALALVDKKAAIYVKDVDAMKHLIPVALETVTDAEKLKTLSENIAKLAFAGFGNHYCKKKY